MNAITGYNIEAFGNTYLVYADASMGAQYIQDSLNLAKISVFQFAYTEYLITDNWLIYLEDYLLKKGLLKFGNKKNFKTAQTDLRRIIKTIETLSEPDYCNEYANQLYDMTILHIEKLRDKIAQTLQSLNVPKAGVCAAIIILQNLICMSTDTFTCIFERVQKLRHIDLKKCFLTVYPSRAAKAIDDMLKDIMGKDRLLYQDKIINNKRIKEMFDAFAQSLYNPQNIEKAQIAAFDAMSDEQKEKYMILEDGRCVLKEEQYGKAKAS